MSAENPQPDAHEDDLPEQLRIRREKRGAIIARGQEAYPVEVPVSYTHLTLPTNREV